MGTQGSPAALGLLGSAAAFTGHGDLCYPHFRDWDSHEDQLTPLCSRNPSQDSQIGIPLLQLGQPLRFQKLMLRQSLATILSLLTFHQLTPAPPYYPASGSEYGKPWQGGFTDLVWSGTSYSSNLLPPFPS